ncbi:BREX-2 system adenine-specific DNA-methyltransferase PglX [Sorangium sp. So ce1000]|uniref:BREX-2 system adenine-specific DNA-methyltransferase PglX n=1 Tax=Sorangium sp. So ce1000 TaxID=3133325 RepID=UPI003F646CE9
MAARKAKAPRKTKSVERNLTRELSALLAKTLLPDLKERARPENVREALRERWAQERKEHRTADDFDDWIPRTLEQIGVAWILSCVFVRTLEDRGYLTHARIAGEGAADAEELFFRLFPSLSVRDYLLSVFRELSHAPGGDDVLGPRHNPAWQLAPGVDATRRLLEFFRETDASGELVWTFEGTDTRFLGDLYQDVSEGVRERFALLQTPEFVEEFILDLTLEPAIKEYGLTEVRIIDPTCGSGHFLLGAFKRIFEARQRKAPGVSPKEHAGAALAQVYGVDLNPYAVAIARFRLVLAYLEAAGIGKLKDAPRVPVNLVVADSLLHGAKDANRGLWEVKGDAAAWGEDAFQLEDPEGAERILGQRYHAVVGNPPYITCKDAELREKYRELYMSAAGKYALAAPFTERLFQLALDGGHVGIINANSFMKREFGKKLITDVLANVELIRVLDTSGAYIPGHGTPTVLLFGRNRSPLPATVRAVLGKRGEPETPTEPEKGLVWSSITAHFDEVGFNNDYVSVVDMPRETLSKHPWSLGGGGAAELKALLESRAGMQLRNIATDIGFDAIMGEDDLFVGPEQWIQRVAEPEHQRLLITGDTVRDWGITRGDFVIFPYNSHLSTKLTSKIIRHLSAYRPSLIERRQFGKNTLEAGLDWFEYRSFYKSKRRTAISIGFAFVATHNHFVLDRGGKVFNRTAPIIKLPETATEEDHLALLAYLNSSTACFYFRQAGHSKGAQGVNEGIKSEAWEQFLEYSGTLVGSVPLPPPPEYALAIVRHLLHFAEAREACMPHALLANARGIDPATLESYEHHAEIALARMCALQEELDWLFYDAFDLLTDADRELLAQSRGEALPNFPKHVDASSDGVVRQGLHPGHRPFEIALVRDCLKADRKTAWFERNGYRSPSEIRDTYAPALQRLLDARVAIIDRNPTIRLLEQPEYKRRWTLRDWKAELRAAVHARLAEIGETEVRHSTSPMSGRRLAEEMAKRATSLGLDGLLGADASDLRTALVDILSADAVPYLAALRYTDSGIEKRADWEHTWALQRREDAGEKDLQIPVPPKYDSKDFRDPTFWRLRGKLDVPKERFISYPGAEKDDDPSPLFGWAGWDHLEQATALAALYLERKQEDGWPADRLVPLLAGLLELVPWLKQWHNEPREDFGGERLGDYYERYVEAEARSLGKTLDDLRAWRPAGRRGRK